MAFSDTIEALAEEYITAADYSVTGDCAKARTFEAALRKLLLLPKSAFHASEQISFAPEIWLQMLTQVQDWIGGNCAPVVPPSGNVTESGNGGAIYFDLRGFRR